jgi:hypothetical protein
VRVALLLYFAVTSFLLGAITLALGGARALASAFLSFSGLFGFNGDEPWARILAILTIGAPGFFLALAIVAVLLGRRGRPLD